MLTSVAGCRIGGVGARGGGPRIAGEMVITLNAEN